MSEKDLVWLPKELADKVKDLTDTDALNREILKFLEETKADLRVTVESIDEDILLYRAKMIQARDAFKKAKDEELEANYTLWENYESDIKKTREYVKTATDVLKELTKEVQELNRAFSVINTDRALGFLTVLQQIQNFNKDEQSFARFIITEFNKNNQKGI